MNSNTTPSLLDRQAFQAGFKGQSTDLITLQNRYGAIAQLTNYGARLVSLWLPDRHGNWADVVLGSKSLEDYVASQNVYGATIGRYGNRIAKAKFEIDGQEFLLPANEKENILHGGFEGFHNQVWSMVPMNEQQVLFRLNSPDGAMGFPGNVTVDLVYSLTDENELTLEYTGSTDAVTHLNLTHHSYFNLAGAGTGPITNHQLVLHADYFVPTDEGMIPTGKLASVENTPMDFRTAKAIGQDIAQPFEPLEFGGGYDHTWVIRGDKGTERLAAEVWDPSSGRAMEIYTNEPGVQFYTSNGLDDPDGKYGHIYGDRGALCLETQHFPDSPNQPNFPSTLIQPGEVYKSVCRHKFGIKE